MYFVTGIKYVVSLLNISCARRRKINNSLYFQYELIMLEFRSIYLIVLFRLKL